ncbi:MAG: hypothetical protein HY553_13030 [Elusimicrobia bacterium]|nr:hypothetical protein [Elusimicrobiota bacterium]
MAKTPEEKLRKSAGKATATLRSMLERSIEARTAFDSAIAEGRLLGGALEAARPALQALRACLARLATLLADVETAPNPAGQAQAFARNQDVGTEVGSAMELLAALPPPEPAERSTQLLVLKGKLGEWAEVQVPLDEAALTDALRSEDWRRKVGRAVAGTRGRLTNIRDRGGAKELEQALDRIEDAVRAGDVTAEARLRVNDSPAAQEIRRKWVELGFFEKMEAYLAVDAEGLALGGSQLGELSDDAKGRAEAVLAAWRKRHEAERRTADFALLGSVYDYTAGQTALDPETGYADRLRAILEGS